MYKMGLEKAEEPEIKLSILDHRETRGFLKNIYFCFIDYPKTFNCADHSNL